MTDKPARPEINVSEHWHVKLPGETRLSKVYIEEITLNTVLLSERRFRGMLEFQDAWATQIKGRYKIEDVEFVGQVK